jgi:hypothetical protein
MKTVVRLAGGLTLAASSLSGHGQAPVDADLDKLVNQTYLQQHSLPPPKLKKDGSAAAKAADDAGVQLKAATDRNQAQAIQSIGVLAQKMLLPRQAGSTVPAAPTASTNAVDASNNSGSAGASVSVGPLNPNCPRTLSYLDSKLPRYTDPDLQTLRQQIIGVDVVDALGKAAAQGYAPKAAVAATVQQAQQAEAALTQSEACVRAYSASPDDAIARLKQGSASINGMGNAAAACSGAYVAAYYGAVAMREVAIDMACLTN